MADFPREPRNYELMVMLLPELADEALTSAIDRVSGYVTSVGADIREILQDSPWGRRRLAYTIRFNGTDYRDGYYAIWHFSSIPSSLGDIERELKLDTNVIRHLLVIEDPKWGSPQEREAAREAANAPTEAEELAAEAEVVEEAAEIVAEVEAIEEVAEIIAEVEAVKEAAEIIAEIEAVEEAAEIIAEAEAVEEAVEVVEAAEIVAEATVDEAAIETVEAATAQDGAAFSRGVKGDGTDNVPDGYPVKGNADSMIYHTPESSFYDRTIAEWYFKTAEDAEAEGFRAPASQQGSNLASAAAAAAKAAAKSEEEN